MPPRMFVKLPSVAEHLAERRRGAAGGPVKAPNSDRLMPQIARPAGRYRVSLYSFPTSGRIFRAGIGHNGVSVSLFESCGCSIHGLVGRFLGLACPVDGRMPIVTGHLGFAMRLSNTIVVRRNCPVSFT